MGDSALSGVLTMQGAVTGACIGFIIILCILLVKVLHIDLVQLGFKIIKKIVSISGKTINAKEQRYHRDLAVGKINEKTRKVKIYRFLNDLIIDLGLKKKGATPYEFLAFIIVATLLITLIFCELVFESMLMAIFMFPIFFIAFICGLYTKANIEHDQRIEAVIESENTISNNIKDGVVVAVRNAIDLMPSRVRGEFRDFLDNIEHKNMHIRTALLELNNNLGSVSDDFIKKCIVFEMEEEHGIAGMFRDVVEINNIKSELRNEMKRKFEEVSLQFVIGATMIFMFLGGVLIIYPDIRDFYFQTVIGRVIIGIDMLLLIAEFVYITALRAKEL